MFAFAGKFLMASLLPQRPAGGKEQQLLESFWGGDRGGPEEQQEDPLPEDALQTVCQGTGHFGQG